MKIDRDLQFEVLSFCRDAYPASAELTQSPFWDHPHIHANLIYLQEHQLIDGRLVNGNMEIWNPGITAKGLDFLEDDGGLSAILGAITVKLDPDDLRALIAPMTATWNSRYRPCFSEAIAARAANRETGPRMGNSFQTMRSCLSVSSRSFTGFSDRLQ